MGWLDAGNVAVDRILEALMYIDVNSGFALQNVMAAEVTRADDGSWWA